MIHKILNFHHFLESGERGPPNYFLAYYVFSLTFPYIIAILLEILEQLYSMFDDYFARGFG
jgi:hypothetical protein